MQQDYLVDKQNISKAWFAEAATITAGDGEVILDIERFAITANNVTYGVAGDAIGYWQFFPAPQGAGRIPVWGIGRVSVSNHAGVKAGDRYYGYYPMSTQLKIRPGRVNPRGMVDASAHREKLPPVYNQYSLMSPENGFEPAFDNHGMVYRPLFTTSFILDDYLADNGFFGASQVVIGSASSKTGFGLAFMLKKRSDVRCVALTSAGNKSFVKGLGLYDEIASYDDVEKLDASMPTVYVDMSGNRMVLTRVHHHFKDKLVNSCGVGITHWDSRTGDAPESLPGAKPRMFFAPTQIVKRNQDWGPEMFQSRLASATTDFFSRVDDWVTIEQHPFAELPAVYSTVVNSAPPDRAYVITV